MRGQTVVLHGRSARALLCCASPIEIAAMKHRPMKAAALLVSASFLLTASVFAQTKPSASAPPPPGMNDPGVKAVAPASATSATAPANGTLNLKPQALPSMQDNGGAGTRDNSIPEIKTHQRGDDVIEEYSRSGQVYMIVVTPKNGIQQTYMVDPQGRVVDEHGQKPTRPVMYKVLEWGKAKPAEASSSDGTPVDDGN
jgi:Protein of unknown function (DUF2782)